jgi:hypothetical protein
MNLFNDFRSQSLGKPSQGLGIGHLLSPHAGELAVQQIGMMLLKHIRDWSFLDLERDSRIDPLTLPPRKGSHKKPRGNEPAFDLRGHLYRILGVDLTQVPGIDALTVNTLLAEVGPDLSKFRSAPAFASWMALCPDNDKSGGKILSVRTRKVKNRAALALRRAAHTLHHSLLWDSSTNACGPSWAHPKPSPPQRINWLASFIIC